MLFFGAAFILFYFSIDSILGHRIDEDLQEDILEFRDLLATEGMAQVQQEFEREVMTDDAEDMYLRLLADDGTEIFSSDLSRWDTHEPGWLPPSRTASRRSGTGPADRACAS